MRRILPLAALVPLALGLLALHRLQPTLAIRVGAGFAARVTCGLVFNSGFDAQRIGPGYVAHMLGGAAPLVHTRVEGSDRSAESRAAWLGRARAVHREGVGCVLVGDADEARLRAFRDPPHAPPLSPRRPWPRGDAALDAAPPAGLAAALDQAFAEPEGSPGRLRQTHAVVVARRGRLVAERYAPGIAPDTRLISWSAAKSVAAALVGAAVHQGRLALREPAPVAEWRRPGDPRAAITLDHLLRMSSGLAFDEHYGAVNDVSRMLFVERDAGAFAASFPLAHPPDTAWSYSSGTSNVLTRILRDLFDADLEAMVRWSRESLFEPAGMRGVVFEADASGSFTGSSLVYATARDWARFGQLHLDDGKVDGRRLLPEGFVRYASTPTAAAPEGRYGAGWWTNGGDPGAPERRMWPTLPRDAYAARGMSGQYVVVVPSEELVVVRLGLAQAEGDELHGIEPLVRAAIDAFRRPAQAAARASRMRSRASPSAHSSS